MVKSELLPPSLQSQREGPGPRNEDDTRILNFADHDRQGLDMLIQLLLTNGDAL